jgi:lipoyl synthase
VLSLCRRIKHGTGKAVSLLIAPTVLKEADLAAMKDAGAERIGVAIDAATPEIFRRLRGQPVRGPHRWERYWDVYEQSLAIFGRDMAGVHLICGLGETEQEMANAIGRARALGGCTHLFSFFPERGSVMQDHPAPPVGVYRRIQLARWLIDNDQAGVADMDFDSQGRIRGFGLPPGDLEKVIMSGSPFRTSGCPGPNGETACNRPYGNEKPGGNIRNFPFAPEASDLDAIVEELKN